MRRERRLNILRTALRLFARRGYQGTSISALAAAAGISKGLMYNYFKSKEELLEHTTQMVLNDLSALFEVGDEGELPALRLERFIRSGFSMLQHRHREYRLFLLLSLQLPRRSRAARMIDQFWMRLFDHANGLFLQMGYPDGQRMAYAYGAMMDGLAFQYVLFGGDRFPFGETVEAIIAQYCGGTTKPAAPVMRKPNNPC
ncbi:MAG: TetR/AcrR family transcriptional regulator [Saprospiraceae bacterium]|nr:TetR/AcrR family transcriptional regulator [Saprospiraceae bacterium]